MAPRRSSRLGSRQVQAAIAFCLVLEMVLLPARICSVSHCGWCWNRCSWNSCEEQASVSHFTEVRACGRDEVRSPFKITGFADNCARDVYNRSTSPLPGSITIRYKFTFAGPVLPDEFRGLPGTRQQVRDGEYRLTDEVGFRKQGLMDRRHGLFRVLFKCVWVAGLVLGLGGPLGATPARATQPGAEEAVT